MRQAIKSEKTS